MSATSMNIQVFAPLQVVSAANYVRYGPNGVRRFGPGTAPLPAPHPQTIQPTLTLKAPTGEILLKLESLLLTTTRLDQEAQTVWMGESQGVKVIWVWDFYRLLSGLALAPTADSAVAEVLQNLPAGSQVIAEYQSRSGQILQVYPLGH